jgi:hypothetical protein
MVLESGRNAKESRAAGEDPRVRESISARAHSK